MMSTCPRVTGSNDPGQRAMATASVLLGSVAVVGASRGSRGHSGWRRIVTSVSPYRRSHATSHRLRHRDGAAARGPLDDDPRPGRQPTACRRARRTTPATSSAVVSYGGSRDTRSNGASEGGVAVEQCRDEPRLDPPAVGEAGRLEVPTARVRRSGIDDRRAERARRHATAPRRERTAAREQVEHGAAGDVSQGREDGFADPSGGRSRAVRHDEWHPPGRARDHPETTTHLATVARVAARS